MTATATTKDETQENHAAEGVQIRRYEANDLDQVRALFVQGMKVNKAPESYIEKSLASDLSDIEGTYMKNDGIFLVMERLHDKRIVGMVGLEPKEEKMCELRRLSIHASERRKGRGRHLLNHFMKHALAHDFRGIQLSTGSWMEAAMKFYSSLGFQDKGRVTYKQPDGSSEVVIANFEMIFDNV